MAGRGWLVLAALADAVNRIGHGLQWQLEGLTMTAATERYLIEAVDGRVDLCESQGDSWVTIQRDISEADAQRAGFNLAAPAVQAVFDMPAEEVA